MSAVIAVLLLGILGWAMSRPQRPSPTTRSEPVHVLYKTKQTHKRFDTETAKQPEPSEDIVGTAYVIDGDSIVIKKTQIRLSGIDAPELNHPYGQKAKWALVKLCKGQMVRAHILAEDDHGRTVAYCTLPDGRDLSAEMVRQGLAIDWPKFSDGAYRELEVPDARKKMWLADARQKGRMHLWEEYEARQQKTAETEGTRYKTPATLR